MSWLFHIPSGSLLVARESRRGWSKVMGLCTCMGDAEEASDFGWAQLWILWPFGNWTSGWKICFCLTNKNNFKKPIHVIILFFLFSLLGKMFRKKKNQHGKCHVTLEAWNKTPWITLGPAGAETSREGQGSISKAHLLCQVFFSF